MRRITLASVLSIYGALAACSSETLETGVVTPPPAAPTAVGEAPDAAPPAPTVDAAPPKRAPSFPEVQSRGGPVIKTPRVVPIVFAGDPLASDIGAFTHKIAASEYWSATAGEYGVGAMSAVAPIVVDEAAPATITEPQLEAWLQQKLTGATPPFGAPDGNTLYALYYPADTVITSGSGDARTSCLDYGGYHFETTVTGSGGAATHVAFAVLPRCAGLDALTVTASHEYFEWTTDPFPQSHPAFSRVDPAHWGWELAMIGELGDLCARLDPANYRPAELGYEVQRFWSNKASRAGTYPCAPARTTAYVQAITPAEDEIVLPDFFDKSIRVKTIRVPRGGSRTVDTLVYSDQAEPLGEVVLLRTASQKYRGSPDTASGFTFTLSKTSAKVGETVQVTIQAPKKLGYDVLGVCAEPSSAAAGSSGGSAPSAGSGGAGASAGGSGSGGSNVLCWPVLVVNDSPPTPDGALSGITPGLRASNASRARGEPMYTRVGTQPRAPRLDRSDSR